MQPNRYLTSNLVLLGLILSACTASLEPRLSSHEPTGKGIPTGKEVQRGPEVSVATEAPVAGQNFNRRFNGSPLKPAATRDDWALLGAVRRSVRNAFDNLDVVRRLTNNIFQLEFVGASREVVRFAINSTIGVGGLSDVAKDGFSIEQRDQGNWFILKWMEKPARNGPSTQGKPGDRTEFRKAVSFNHREYDDKSWQAVSQSLKEGDVIAYRMDKWEARTEIFLKGRLNKIGYRLFKYGHAAIVVRDPYDGNTLRLLSSQAFKGPNLREDLDSLRFHSWDSYRLNQWDRVDKKRLYEFIGLVRQKAEKWDGYDFSGVFGLWNSNLQPGKAEDISYEYICSTVIVAALRYAGVELDASHRHGIIDIITPFQLVRSKGRVISPPTEANGHPGKGLEDAEERIYRQD